MKIIVLGADGYLGLPTCIDLARDHTVVAVDNLLKRDLLVSNDIHYLHSDVELNELDPVFIDVANWESISHLVKRIQPDVIINYAEIPSAPYSMADRKQGMKTIMNNIKGNLNIIYAL